MKNLMIAVGFVVSTGWAMAQVPKHETGLKGQLRPWIVRILGEKTATQILGEPPEVIEEISLPTLPTMVKQTTDVSVYNQDTELRRQGAEFLALPADKRRAYEISFLKELFEATRRAPAKEEDLVKWMNVLEGGGSREGVYRGLVLDDVYASLEGYEEAPSAKLVAWSTAFAKKFLGLAFQPDAFKQANLFFIKRHVSEKVLEMMDTLETNPDDFRRWYAVFSVDLAKDFPQAWPGSIRADQKATTHYNWAKKAPLQHIKSEVLIKLHTAMNSLQEAQ